MINEDNFKVFASVYVHLSHTHMLFYDNNGILSTNEIRFFHLNIQQNKSIRIREDYKDGPEFDVQSVFEEYCIRRVCKDPSHFSEAHARQVTHSQI